MDFSVAICTWNRAALLRRTLERFCELQVPSGVSWEMLVINNRCTDETDDVLRAFADRLPLRRVYEEKAGQSAARNRAIAEFQGDKLIFTDDDVIPRSDWLACLLDTFTQFQADVVFGRSEPVWLTREPSWFGPQFMGQFALLDYGPTAFVASRPEQQFYGLNMAFTRDAVMRVGRYREDLGYVGAGGGGGDDTNMFERCRAERLKIVYQPSAVVGHMIPEDRTTKKRQRQLAWRGGEANFRMVKAKHSGPSWFGVPRFMYRIALDDLSAWLSSAVRRRRSEAFFHEVRLFRFVGLLRAANR